MAPTPVPRLDGASIQINELFYVFFGYRTLDENESNKDEDESTSGGSDDGSDTQAKKPESSVTKKDDTTPSTCHEKKLKSTDLIEEKQKEVIVEKVREPTKSHVNEETNAEHMIKEEAKFLRVAMGHDDEDIDEFVEIHKTCLNDVMYFPTHDAYGLSSVAGNMEKHTASKKEYFGSIINSSLSEVVLGKPFTLTSKLTYDESLGLIRFAQKDDEVVFRMPQRTKELDLVSPLEKDKFEAFFMDSLKVIFDEKKLGSS
ncbi:hypothetical protein Tco_0835542 [Tanacetum coccineum]